MIKPDDADCSETDLAEALREMRNMSLGRRIGRKLDWQDAYVWLTARKTLPQVWAGHITVLHTKDRICIEAVEEGQLWLSRNAAAELCHALLLALIDADRRP